MFANSRKQLELFVILIEGFLHVFLSHSETTHHPNKKWNQEQKHEDQIQKVLGQSLFAIRNRV